MAAVLNADLRSRNTDEKGLQVPSRRKSSHGARLALWQGAGK